VLGGAFGGGLSGAGELWKATAGKALGAKLDKLTDAINNGKPLPAEVAGIPVAAELRGALSQNPMARGYFETLAKGSSKSAAKVQGAIEQAETYANDVIAQSFGKSIDDVPKIFNVSKSEVGEDISQNLVKRLSEKYEPIAKSYEKIEGKFKQAALSDADKSELISKIQQVIIDNGLDKGPNKSALKLAQASIDDVIKQGTVQDLRQYASQLRDMAPFGSENFQAIT
jgi:hypothetical protein